MSQRSCVSPFLKQSLANSHRSGTIFRKPCEKKPKKIKFPFRPININNPTYISVKLANEAGKIVVLKILRKEIPGKLDGTPYDERGAVLVP